MYNTCSWQALSHFPSATSDASDLSWSPAGDYICVVDGPLTYNIAVHAADGRPLASYVAAGAAEGALGVKSVAWNPSGELLAVGSHDQVGALRCGGV